MTLTESMVWSFVRCLTVASISIAPLMILTRQIESRSSLAERRLWILLSILPFFVPELLIGFHYRLTATQLSSGSSLILAALCTELLYAALQVARCVSAGVMITMLLPRSPITEESLHSWKLLRPSTGPSENCVMSSGAWRLGWLRLRLNGTWQPLLISWSLMALTAFQEFEAAALMQIDRFPIVWTVWLFDAHAARQPLTDSLRMVSLPLLCEFLLLTPALLVMALYPRSNNSTATAALHVAKPGRGHDSLFAIACLVPGVLLYFAWPVLGNFRTTWTGLIDLLTDGSRLQQSLQEILISVGFAVAASLVALNAAVWLLSKMRHSPSGRRRWLLLLFLMPGLLGSLVLSLVLLAIFQWPGFRPLYDSWLPLLLGQSLAVLPKAMGVVLLLNQITDPAAIHSAKLLQNSSDPAVREAADGILWRMTTSRWVLGGLVIGHWCFWDVTVASILRPVRLEPIVTRLYNEMHYGRTEALMSRSILACATPLLVWLTIIAIASLPRRLRYRKRTAAEPS